MRTDAQKRARNKYQAKADKIVSIRMRAEEAERLDAIAARNGTTRHAILLSAARAYIAGHSKGQPPEQAETDTI